MTERAYPTIPERLRTRCFTGWSLLSENGLQSTNRRGGPVESRSAQGMDWGNGLAELGRRKRPDRPGFRPRVKARARRRFHAAVFLCMSRLAKRFRCMAGSNHWPLALGTLDHRRCFCRCRVTTDAIKHDVGILVVLQQWVHFQRVRSAWLRRILVGRLFKGVPLNGLGPTPRGSISVSLAFPTLPRSET